MNQLETTLGYVWLLGQPLLAVLTALQPLGRFYIASVVATIALFFISCDVAMKDADGPGGFGVMLYFALLLWLFIGSHGIKLTFILLKWAYGKWMHVRSVSDS